MQGGSEAFEEWALMQREQLRQIALDALCHLAQHNEWRREYGQTLRYARRNWNLSRG